MYLRQIKLTNFRNYDFQSLKFSERLNLITGLNGMGKTNLLDAIYYLCMGKSYFQHTDKNVVKKGEQFFRLEGDFQLEKNTKITAKVVPGTQKILEKNEVVYPKISDHVGLFPVVFLAPDDTLLALEGSEERRRFLDNSLCQVDHQYLESLILYNRLLDNRNALLKSFADKGSFNLLLLETITQQMQPFCNYIFEKRTWFMQQFHPLFNRFYNLISEEKEPVDCLYKSQLETAGYEALMSKNLEKDKLLQRTNGGIHKDDLQFMMKELPLKKFASQGQLKSFVLSLKLAQCELLRQHKGKKPILLLDDLFDKLDDQRVSLIIQLLTKEEMGQVFITDTHPERAESLAKQFFFDFSVLKVENGSVS